MFKLSRLCARAALALGSLGSAAVAAVPSGGYKITDLGPGSFSGTPTAPSINNLGQVAMGVSSPPAIWSNGTLTPLAGPADARALAVNPAGVVVGGLGGPLSPVRWVGGTLETLGDLVPGTGDQVSDINSAGHIAITTSLGGYLLKGDTATFTGLRRIEGISDSGVAVGNVLGGSGLTAARSIDGVAVPLAGAPGDSLAMDVNEAGMIVGHRQFSSIRRPFRWTDGVFAALPVLSTGASTLAVAVSESGDAVGYSLAPDRRAILWSGSQVYDLQSLLSGGEGWTLHAATSINDSGEIVGSGLFNGEQRIFLLTPIPAPGAACSFIIPGVLLALNRRRPPAR